MEIWAQDSNLHIADKRLLQGLNTVTTWSKDRKMMLSTQKSECSFFSTNSHESKWQPTLTLDGQPVGYNATPKFHGVAYERQLTFSRHAALVGNSLKRQAGALQKLASTSWGYVCETLVQHTSQQVVRRWNTAHIRGCRGYQTQRWRI